MTNDASAEQMLPQIMSITPEIAQDLLARNDQNRPVDQGLVKMIAKEILNGRFRLTHQGIAVDGPLRTGKLLDGQHRLLAVLKAGIPARMFVFENAPAETFMVLDTGKRRSGSDVLALDGERDTMLLAATVRHVHLLRTAPSGSWVGSRSRITNNEMLEIFNKQPEDFRNAVKVGRNLGQHTGMIPTAGAAAFLLTREAAPDTPVEEWLEGLYSGANLGATDPRLAFIKAMNQMRGGNSKRRTTTRAHVGLYFKAWNSWVTKKQVKVLRLQDGELLPKPIQIRIRE